MSSLRGVQSLAVMSSVAGWPWGKTVSTGRLKTEVKSAVLFLFSLCLLFCAIVPTAFAILFIHWNPSRTPTRCCCLCPLLDVKGTNRMGRHRGEICCNRASINLKTWFTSQHWSTVAAGRGEESFAISTELSSSSSFLTWDWDWVYEGKFAMGITKELRFPGFVPHCCWLDSGR